MISGNLFRRQLAGICVRVIEVDNGGYMKCEICDVREAAIVIRRDINGDVREMHICRECAVIHRDLVSSSFPLADLLFGFSEEKNGGEKESAGKGVSKVCSCCGMSRREFVSRQRLGCSECYDAHSAEVLSMVHDMQRSDSHIGKIPHSLKVMVVLDDLKRELSEAVALEHYEQAAVLRDKINAFNGGNNAG